MLPARVRCISLAVVLLGAATSSAHAAPALTSLAIQCCGVSTVTLLSPDGSLIVGQYEVFHSSGSSGTGVRWTAASGWAQSPSVGFRNSDVEATYTQEGLSATNVLAYNQIFSLIFMGGATAADAAAPGLSLPIPPACGPNTFRAEAISADGGTVTGSVDCGGAFRTNGGATAIIAPVGATTSRGTYVSDDGSAIAGVETSPSLAPFVWTLGGGYQLLPIALHSGTEPILSGDGSTLAGTAATANGTEAFVWDAANGAQYLGDLPGGAFDSRVVDVSADGSLVTGNGRSALGSEAFAWTSGGGLVGYGAASVAVGMTPAGVVVGTLVGAPNGDDVFLWNPATGWKRTLESLLRDQGGIAVDPNGLGAPIGISDDASVVAGNLWVATEIGVPECSNGVDDDGDGLVDVPADPGCRNGDGRLEAPQCSNGVDDDLDLAVDHPADARCRGPWDNDEASDPASCGLGAELALVLALLGRARARLA